MPSVGIYTYELYHFYDVENIIRIGSAGSLQDNVNVKDLVFAMASCNDSRYGYQYSLPGPFSPAASFDLLEKAVAVARELKVPFHVGNVLSTDVFYRAGDENDRYREMGVLACEMESAALYINAAEAKKKALTILTVSDHIYKNQEMSSEERQVGFRQMMEVALKTAVQL
ncbi:MAG: purine-nucleoside phosphorylase, partial [Lachnospiraceae bacterium]|nr:purine-nucleoside phosphorylase [Lachnospiraceae bacterium]